MNDTDANKLLVEQVKKQRAEIRRLRKALRPFAEYATQCDGGKRDNAITGNLYADCANARDALKVRPL